MRQTDIVPAMAMAKKMVMARGGTGMATTVEVTGGVVIMWRVL